MNYRDMRVKNTENVTTKRKGKQVGQVFQWNPARNVMKSSPSN